MKKSKVNNLRELKLVFFLYEMYCRHHNKVFNYPEEQVHELKLKVKGMTWKHYAIALAPPIVLFLMALASTEVYSYCMQAPIADRNKEIARIMMSIFPWAAMCLKIISVSYLLYKMFILLFGSLIDRELVPFDPASRAHAEDLISKLGNEVGECIDMFHILKFNQVLYRLLVINMATYFSVIAILFHLFFHYENGMLSASSGFILTTILMLIIAFEIEHVFDAPRQLSPCDMKMISYCKQVFDKNRRL